MAGWSDLERQYPNIHVFIVDETNDTHDQYEIDVNVVEDPKRAIRNIIENNQSTQNNPIMPPIVEVTAEKRNKDDEAELPELVDEPKELIHSPKHVKSPELINSANIANINYEKIIYNADGIHVIDTTIKTIDNNNNTTNDNNADNTTNDNNDSIASTVIAETPIIPHHSISEEILLDHEQQILSTHIISAMLNDAPSILALETKLDRVFDSLASQMFKKERDYTTISNLIEELDDANVNLSNARNSHCKYANDERWIFPNVGCNATSDEYCTCFSEEETDDNRQNPIANNFYVSRTDDEKYKRGSVVFLRTRESLNRYST